MDIARLSDTTEYSSLSNYNDFTVSHIHLDWSISFVTSKISGSVTLDIQSTTDALKKIVLDTRDLNIESVEVDDKKATHSTGMSSFLGAALTIPLTNPIANNGKAKVRED
jgi:aminopeptidase N